MFGITNAANIKSDGGGQLVYAVDNTNEGIVAGKKYWLTQRKIFHERTYYFQDNRNQNFARFFFDKAGYIYQHDKYSWGRHWLDEEGVHQWVTLGSQQFANGFPCLFRQRCGRIYALNGDVSSRNMTFVLDYLTTKSVSGYFYLGKYKGKEYAMTKGGNPSSFTVYEFDVESGVTIGEALCTFRPEESYVRSASLDESGNLYMDSNADNKATIWDLSGVLDGTASEPVLLSTLALTAGESLLEGGFTGFGEGDWLFCQNKGASLDLNCKNRCCLKIYRLNANRQPVAAVNLPLTLRNAIGTTAYVVYDDNTGILTLGTHDNVYAYIVNKKTKAVTELNIGIKLPTGTYTIRGDAPYALYLAEDLSRAVITFGRNNSGYDYWCFQLYEFSALDDDWHATETYTFGNNSTLTGTATGKTNEAGLCEFKTVLPETAMLTLDFEVEPDVLEFIGGVK